MYQYAGTHRNRYVISLAYDNRTYAVHMIITHHTPTNPQINTHKQTRRYYIYIYHYRTIHLHTVAGS